MRKIEIFVKTEIKILIRRVDIFYKCFNNVTTNYNKLQQIKTLC